MKVTKTTPCPHCEKEIPPRVYKRHVFACARRPSDAELTQMRRDGMSAERIAAGIDGVSRAVVTDWLRACGAYAIRVRGTRRSTVEVYPAKAFLKRREGGCAGCQYLAPCSLLEQSRERVLCEAPDEIDLVNEAKSNGNGSTPRPGHNNRDVFETMYSIARPGNA